MAGAGHRYQPGDRVVVTGGYDGDDSAWLQGGAGYAGVINALTAHAASVELDDELELDAGEGQTWEDFGGGAPEALRQVQVARGRWLVLLHGWVGQEWKDPIVRVHVGLCAEEPDLYAIPTGGGAGCWVESHATCFLEDAA
jgi:hypothetical protein